jgi:hypothetical protein
MKPSRGLVTVASLSVLCVELSSCKLFEKGDNAATSTATPTAPYGGKVVLIPGTIEAENFDEGPAGSAYHDLDKANQGAPYRLTEVDIEARPDASGGHGVGWTKAGEWLVYTVEVSGAGSYAVEIPVASPATGAVFHLELDGKDLTGPIEVPNTGSWQKLQTITRSGLQLHPGRHVLRLVLDKESEAGSVADIDLLRFRRA